MRRHGVLVAALALVVAGCAGPGAIVTASAVASRPQSTELATAAPPVGSITFFKHDADNRWEIWTACADLSKAQRLSREPGHNAGWSVWSPDGSRIAFNADFDDPDMTDSNDVWDIYTTDRAGGDLRRLTHSVGLEGDPSYSPDGTLIAFDSTEPGKQGIWVMDAADGGHQRLVSALPGGSRTDYAPRFSPDGKSLVFTREVDDKAAALWTIGLDGSGLRRITPADIYPNKPAWSHDGKTIVFNAWSDDPIISTIWVVRPDGEGLKELPIPRTDPRYRDGYSAPVWSPDDSRILTTHGVHEGGTPRLLGLATVRPDGTDLRWVADGLGFEKYPDWTSTPC